MNKYLKIFISSLMAGFMITIGATVFLTLLAQSNKSGDFSFKLIGSLMFTFGLYIIIHFKFWLYTGKVGLVLDNKPKYFLDLLVCIVGNMLGVFILSSILKCTRIIDPSIIDACTSIVNAKQNDSWYSILILSFMCGIMIYLAVKGHEKCSYTLGKFAICFLAISVFILCSYEHCVANVCYYTYAGIFNFTSLFYFALMIVGNALGSIFFDGMLKLIEKIKD